MKSNSKSKLNTDQLELVRANMWRMSPARMMEHLTQGEYKRYHHIKYIDDVIRDAVIKGGARIILSMPPRHGKSFLISRGLPIWYLSQYPKKNVILASYEAAFASQWGRQVRNFINDHLELGIQVSDDSSAADRWNLTEGGGMFCTGAGGPITGRGGDLIIVDDIVKNYEEAQSEIIRQNHIDWYNSTLSTRAEPNASIIVVMTRWHEEDLAGYLLAEQKGKWLEIRFPAISEDSDVLGRKPGEALCRERYDVPALKDIKKSIGVQMWASLYQQRPAPLEGALFKRDMFHFGQLQPSYDYTFVTCDTAYSDKQTSDFTCAVAWGVKETQLYILDVFRQRVKAADIEGPLSQFIRRHMTYGFRGVFIEPRGHGLYLNQMLPRKGIVVPSETQLKEFYIDRGKDKVMRANNAIPNLSDRKIIINESLNDKEELLSEVLGFPNAKHDDFTDCVIDGVKYWAQQTSGGLSICDVLYSTSAERELYSRFGKGRR